MLPKLLIDILNGITFPDIDSEKILEILSNKPIYTITSSLDEIYAYAPLGENHKVSDSMTVINEDTGGPVIITSIVDVDKAGLAFFFHRQLSYVPHYAIFEWYLNGPTGIVRGFITSIKYTSESQTPIIGNVPIRSSVDVTDPGYTESVANPFITKEWLFPTIEALVEKALVTKKSNGPLSWAIKLAIQTTNTIQ